MNTFAALIYWVIVILWLGVLLAIGNAYIKNPKTFGTAKLLLLVLAIDTSRNVVENIYFGSYFGSKYGLLPASIADTLGNPYLLILPKVVNVVAACFVLGVLFLRWFPMAQHERLRSESTVRKAAKALETEMEEHRRLLETSADLIVVTDRDRIVKRISNSCQNILGFAPSETVDRYGGDFMLEDDLEANRVKLQAAMISGDAQKFRSRFVRKDGTLINLDVTVVWSKQVQRFFLIGRDMTDAITAEEKLKQLALFDHLTALPNRANLIESLQAFLDRGGSSRLSIAIFDLDGFKQINDAYGHATGDAMLRKVAEHGSSILDGGVVYRLGGDEFVMVFPDCADPLVIRGAMNALINRCEQGFDIDGRNLAVGISAGMFITDASSSLAVDELLYCADLALYDAKSNGGRKCSLFVPSMRSDARAKQDMEVQIRRASKDKEFEVFYQPQIRLRDGAIVGAEALLRWRHPVLGLLTPAAFIDILSQSSCAFDVGSWILNTACSDAAHWRQMGLGNFRVGVNLFPCQYRDTRLTDHVKQALEASGLPSQLLELEITENIAIGKDDTALEALRSIRGTGVSLAFDDFGTGYASLSYLTQFPLNRIKIDRSFVSKINADSSSDETAIVRSMIVMAHNLGLEVIAEGIETQAQAAFLASRKCDEAQGFYYAKPMSAADFINYARSTSGGFVQIA